MKKRGRFAIPASRRTIMALRNTSEVEPTRRHTVMLSVVRADPQLGLNQGRDANDGKST